MLKLRSQYFNETEQRLDVFLATHFGFHSRSAWKKQIQMGNVLVNKHRVSPSSWIKKEDEIDYLQNANTEPPVEREFEILYQDEEIMLIDKPSNLPIHPCGKYYKNTLTEIFRDRGISYHPTHRLDRETSGIIICAKSTHTREIMRNMFAVQQVEKEYLAVTVGRFAEKKFTINSPLAYPLNLRGRKKMRISAQGAPATTEFSMIKQKGNYTLLRIFPKTGRTNQIRAHLEFNNTPIVGDTLYNIYDGISLPDPPIRLALHAYRVSFNHPLKKNKIIIRSKLPMDLKRFWKSLPAF